MDEQLVEIVARAICREKSICLCGDTCQAVTSGLMETGIWKFARAAIAGIEREAAQRPWSGDDSLLCEVAQLMQSAKQDWEQTKAWTEWDQSVQDRFSDYRKRLAALKQATR